MTGQELRATVGDVTLAYTKAGSGPPVVLIHGLAQDGSSWAEQQRRLDGYETYAMDLRGFGCSTLGEDDGTLAQLGGDLAGFLEEVTGPAACVGFSLGGTIVLEAALQASDLVTHAIVIGTSSVVGRQAARYYEERIAMALAGDMEGLVAGWTADTRAGLVDPDSVDLRAHVGERIAAVGSGGGFINASRAMVGLRDAPLTPRLGDIRCHVDVVGGELDAFCPRKAADIMLGALADAAYHEIPRTGHLMTIEQPAAITELLTTLLSRKGTV